MVTTILTIYLAISIVMGAFSASQLQYQERIGGVRELFRGILSFLRGVVAWPILLPLGIMKRKYRFNVYHKVINRNINI